jgi:hypothetical protein
MESKSVPQGENQEMTMYRLSGEGFNFLLAGTETTAVSHTLIGDIGHILTSLSRLPLPSSHTGLLQSLRSTRALCRTLRA